MKSIETYTSTMFVHVRYYIYEPKVVLRVKGVIQIHHGLGEHADRYDHFASYLLNQGFVVVVSDFVGHGKSLIDFEQGYFGNQNGPDNLIKDMHHLQNIIREKYPDVPYFMLGVDLGSIMIRKYVSQYGDFVDGIILLGTLAKVEYRYLKLWYLRFMRHFKGPIYKANHYFQSFHHHNNKKIFQFKTEADWLTSDEAERMKYLNDPMTHFSYTVQGYKDIIESVHEVNSDECISKIPTYLPIYIGVGEFDPLSKGIEKLVEKYKKAQIYDLTFQVFKKKRHALLFEKNKQEIYLDILKWLNDRTYL